MDYWQLSMDDDTTNETDGEPTLYLQALDAINEINNDVCEIVFEAQSVLGKEKLEQHLLDGCVSITFGILPSLTDQYELKR
jgi:hypothetical protein